MKRGSSIAVFAVGIWMAPVWAAESVNLPVPPGPNTTATMGALKKEAYFHFFLEDYLTAATRLKLLESVQRDPETLNHTRLLRGSLYLVWGMHRLATHIFDQLVSEFPPGYDRNQVLLLIERLQYSRALYSAAVSTYERLTPDPTFPSVDQAAYLAGMSHYALGDFEQTLDVMTTIPASSPYVPFAKITSAKSHNQLANIDDAIEMLTDIGKMKAPQDAGTQALSEKSRLTLGLLLTETGRYEEAIPVFASVPESSPFFPDALFGTGWAHLYRREYPASLAAFLRLLHAAPNHPYSLEALTTIGHCYDRMGARGEALKAYGTALNNYRREQQSFEAMRGLINDRGRLGALLSDLTAALDSPIGPLLDDEGLRYWVKQYGELGALDAYLVRRLEDMGVFEVMVDHREAVFRDRLPMIRGFLTDSPVTPLRNRTDQQRERLHQAIQHETAEAWAFGPEAGALGELSRARRQSRTIAAELARAESENASSLRQREELVALWKSADRSLSRLQGEQLWTILTEIPGRRDDLQRTMTQIESELKEVDRHQRILTESISGLETTISQFRQRIQATRQEIAANRIRLTELRAQLLPSLQTLLSNAVDRRSNQMEAMAAVARLSQVHVMDILTQ